MSEYFSVIIDTTHYAGNFERELCAWLTGQVGDCGVGDGVARLAREELKHADWWAAHVLQRSEDDDDNGCLRPVAIAPTPGYFNHGMGAHFEETPENEALALKDYQEKVREYNQNQIDRLAHNVPGVGGWTEQNLEDHKQQLLRNISDARELTKVQHWPSYQSVAIFTDEALPKAVFEELNDRVKAFEANPEAICRCSPGSAFKVLGVREVATTPQAVVRSVVRPR